MKFSEREYSEAPKRRKES